MAKLKHKSFVTSLDRADKKTGWVGKKVIVHLPISVTKWVWMASLKKSMVAVVEIKVMKADWISQNGAQINCQIRKKVTGFDFASMQYIANLCCFVIMPDY